MKLFKAAKKNPHAGLKLPEAYPVNSKAFRAHGQLVIDRSVQEAHPYYRGSKYPVPQLWDCKDMKSGIVLEEMDSHFRSFEGRAVEPKDFRSEQLKSLLKSFLISKNFVLNDDSVKLYACPVPRTFAKAPLFLETRPLFPNDQIVSEHEVMIGQQDVDEEPVLKAVLRFATRKQMLRCERRLRIDVLPASIRGDQIVVEPVQRTRL